ncbi:conserved hypothetical protein [Thermobaculum terrenum ATCC BAA-798]|uniref:DUF2961 domain-containing protein n=1 Tax=Thermobaculum terrenum (strain ATCC BAA-798 / CCMEE 7001 / YNP1) TaxID=525904 RepID=D1CF34_THET1|nr:glycoside hydrolase family 172 protein [Thermobaculum terrenum]ACZ41540.1 conserved hypothetical protein [Thermobaculum terrenum ATCC BAA-798]
MHSPLANIAQIRPARSKRISSYDRTGGNADRIQIAAGERVDLASIEGAGAIKHIWFTIASRDPMYRRNIVLRMYWDGEDNPSVESPVGDFFGQGWGLEYNFVSLPLAASPRSGRGLNCYFPMPFGNGARIEVENQSPTPVDAFYFYIDYEEWPEVDDSLGRFHAWWNREITDPDPSGENEWSCLAPELKHPSDEGNYLILDAEGRGHYVGVNYFVDCPSPMWYGEGDDMFLIDGEPWPGTLHGTGTEDYFCTSWSPAEEYQHPYFGYAHVDHSFGWLGRAHAYRFHIEDPIHFQESIRASIEHGHANNLTLDICTVAYWYQTEPHKPFPQLPPSEARHPMPAISVTDVHRWRHAWRQSMGGGKLWGNERPS